MSGAADAIKPEVMKQLFHPEIEDVLPADVFAALGDPIRLGILVSLADCDEVDKARCGAFTELASPSLLSYHFAKLREAGITRSRAEGTVRFLSIRREDSGVSSGESVTFL